MQRLLLLSIQVKKKFHIHIFQLLDYTKKSPLFNPTNILNFLSWYIINLLHHQQCNVVAASHHQ